MKIGITLNEVFRDFIGQFAYTYNKYKHTGEGDFALKEDQVTSFDLIKHFPFNDVDEMNEFLYSEASLEIFGHADQLHDNVMSLFNHFLMDIEDEEEHEIILISREAIKSVPATFWFLSKLGCRAMNIRFVTQYEDKWDHCDVLITANPKALNSKPSGKISVKVDASYNKDVKADFEIKNIMEFMADDDLRDKILNTTITSYEEIE